MLKNRIIVLFLVLMLVLGLTSCKKTVDEIKEPADTEMSEEVQKEQIEQDREQQEYVPEDSEIKEPEKDEELEQVMPEQREPEETQPEGVQAEETQSEGLQPEERSDIKKNDNGAEEVKLEREEKEDTYKSVNECQAYQIVSEMTLEQKIGQMIMPAFQVWQDENGNYQNVLEINEGIERAIKTYGFGGVILFASNCRGTEQTVKLISSMQEASVSGLAKLPMLVAVDQEGGYVTRLYTGTNTCGNMALGALGDETAVHDTAELMASELYALGFNVNFGPDVDVNNNPDNPVIGIRSFSSSPELVGKLGRAYIAGMREDNIACALKHFPGHGDTSTDSHTGLPCINKSYDELKNLELIPFAEGIAAGADMIMTAHIQYPQIEQEKFISASTGKEVSLPATLSKTIISGILRGDLGYDGVVTTDAMNMGAIAENFGLKDAAKLAICADVDILLMPVTISSESEIAAMGEYISSIAEMVRNGEIPEETVNDSAERIVQLKIDRGILEAPQLSCSERTENAVKIVGSKAHHDFELEIAERAVTLLKNEENVLPIKPQDGEKIVVFCAYENEINSINFAIAHLKEKNIISQNVQVDALCYRGKTAADFSNEIDSAKHVLLMTETYGKSNMDIASGWQAIFEDELVGMLHENGKKLALISTQLPYDAAAYQNADAILLAYGAIGMEEFPQEYDGNTRSYGVNIPAAICVAFGERSPEGKLPVDIPVFENGNYKSDEILYSLGYGLSCKSSEE